jgi:hypothetical protein
MSTETSTPSVVETNVVQSAGSKASLALEGRVVPSHERGFQKRSRALALSAGSSNPFLSMRLVVLRFRSGSGCDARRHSLSLSCQ